MPENTIILCKKGHAISGDNCARDSRNNKYCKICRHSDNLARKKKNARHNPTQ